MRKNVTAEKLKLSHHTSAKEDLKTIIQASFAAELSFRNFNDFNLVQFFLFHDYTLLF